MNSKAVDQGWLHHRLLIGLVGLLVLGSVPVWPQDAAASGTGTAAKAEDEEADVAPPQTSARRGDGNHGFIRIETEPGEIVRIGSDAVVQEGEKVSQLVVIFGNAIVEGEVEGDMVVVFGRATINGKVGGDAVTVMGSTAFGSQAKVGGETITVGGKIEKSPGADLGQAPVEVHFSNLLPSLEPVGRWIKEGFLLGRPIAPGVGWVWWIVLLHFLIYLLILVVLPKPVEACVKIIEQELVVAFLVGLLAMVLYAIAVFILLCTGLGIFLIPFLWMAFLAARFVGKTATFAYFGGLPLKLNASGSGNGQTVNRMPGFLTGSALVTLLYMVPLVGVLVWGFLRVLGLGAAIMAVFQGMRRNGAGAPAPVMPGTPAPGGETGGSGAVTEAGPGPEAGTDISRASNPAVALTPVPGVTAAVRLPPMEVAGMPRVGFWLRLGATLLDFVLLSWLIATVDGFFVPIWIAYHVAMWMWKGTTIGGIVCGIKVVRLDGRAVDFSVALVRALAAVFSFVALGLGFFWVGWTRERQSWHDTIAGTVIVKVPKGMSLI